MAINPNSHKEHIEVTRKPDTREKRTAASGKEVSANYELILKKNLAAKAAMAEELIGMGLSEQAIMRLVGEPSSAHAVRQKV